MKFDDNLTALNTSLAKLKDSTRCGDVFDQLYDHTDFVIVDIYSRVPGDITLTSEILDKINIYLRTHGKICVTIDVGGWFDHEFMLYHFDEIYILHAYICEYLPKIDKFDLTEMFLKLVKIHDLAFESKESVVRIYDEIQIIWNELWDVNGASSSSAYGAIDYMNITLRHPKEI